MRAAIAIFALTAVGGLGMFFIRLGQGSNPPDWLAMVHGILAATGVLALIVAAVRSGLPNLAKVALALFVLAAAGGLFLMYAYQSAGELLPIVMILLHGTLALSAFGLLVAAVVSLTGPVENRLQRRR